MEEQERVSNLEELLDQATDADEGAGSASVDDILDHVGHRSFGPFLLVLALVAFTPLGGIPGLPTVLAALVILITGQLLIGMDQFWLPRFIRRQRIARGKLETTVRYLRPVARVIDKALRPRLTWLTRPPFVRVTATACILVALTVPPLEVVPFAGSVSWAAIAAFGLAFIAHDGVLALIAFACAIGAGYAIYATVL